MEFDQLMLEIENHIATKSYVKALELLEKAHALLMEKDFEADHSKWAYFYDYKRFCLYELGRTKEALEICLQALKKLTISAQWEYLPEYNIVRSAKRAACNMLAWEIQKEAATESDIEEAIKYIDECFQTISPIEDSSVLNGFFDTRALVYQKAAMYNSQKYKLLFFQNLEALEKSGIPYDEALFSNWLQNPDYLAFKSNNPIEKLKHGEAHEKWPESLERYKKVLELMEPDLEESMAKSYQITYKKRESLARLQELEKQYNCEIPDILKKLYMETGAFSIKDAANWGSLQIYEMPNIGGLVTMIDKLWSGRPEFIQYFSTEQIKFLNDHYLIFGHYFFDDNSYDHFYFDRQGKFGILTYDQDDFTSALKEDFRPLLQASLANLTLDELISKQVDKAIESLLEDEL